MTDIVQTAVVVLIGASAAAYLLRQAWRRVRPRAAQQSARCGACSGCGACPPTRRR